MSVVAVALGVVGVAAAPAGATPQGEHADFIVTCPFSHRLPDDPIRFPGQPGASHSHDFFGNVSTSAGSSYASLLAAGTTCQRSADTAAYWMPTVYDHGVPLTPLRATIYYRDMAPTADAVQSFPPGFRMIAGDMMASASAPQRPKLVGWACRHDSGPSEGIKGRWTAGVPTCRPNTTLVFRVRFPDCWDGVHLDSADHMSHVAYGRNDVCPAGYPVSLPRVSMTTSYPSLGGPGLTLASGSAFTGHADFLNSWQQPALDRLVDQCLRQGVHCGFSGP